MTRRRGEDPISLRESLTAVSRDLGLPDPGALARLLQAWPDLVGPAAAQHSWAESLRDGALTVAVDDPAWATPLRYLVADLLRAVGEQVAPGLVREVRVLVRDRRGTGDRHTGLVD